MALAKGGYSITVGKVRDNLGILTLIYRTDANGDLDVTTDQFRRFGRLVKIVRKPTDTHSANWDLTVDDENKTELTTNTACHASNTETDRPSLVNTYFHPEFSELNFLIANAGDGKNGVIQAFFEG
jgi:hypothetical protein